MVTFAKVSSLLLALALLPAGLAGAPSGDPVGPVGRSALISIPVRVEIGASAEKVWSVVTSFKGFGALSGFVIDGDGAFDGLGQSVEARVWDDRGRLFVTGFEPSRELRVTWEPTSGGYLCAKRIVLTARPSGTTLEYLDRYSDDQPDAEDTARRVREETARGLQAFLAMVRD